MHPSCNCVKWLLLQDLEIRMAVYALDDLTPELAESAWVAEGARVMGNVRMAADASV